MIFRYSRIYLLNSNKNYYFFSYRYIDLYLFLIYIIYLITIVYTSFLKYRSILSLKLLTEALFGIEIDTMARNKLYLNYIEL